MVKTRPVVVIRPHKRNSKLVTVVPLSTTEPTHLDDYHHQLSASPLPNQEPGLKVWAKCDMLSTVSIDRLDRYKVGRGDYRDLKIGLEDFDLICKAVLAGLGL